MSWISWIGFEWEDALKIFLAFLTGLLMGVEREKKDKAAGLKTMTLITLGSTVFTLLSYKIGSDPYDDATRIASYVVSGVGFLGAGVIFKTTYSVSGLTTAATIWASAAIGMSFGFGKYAIGFMLLFSSLVILLFGAQISHRLFKAKTFRSGYIEFNKGTLEKRDQILDEFRQLSIYVDEKTLLLQGDKGRLYIDVSLFKENTQALEDLLVNHPLITGFQL